MDKEIFKIIDWSRNYRVCEDGNLMSMTIQTHPNNRYEIIAEGCVLPSSSNFTNSRNDTIVRDIENGQFVFTCKRFLSSTLRYCSQCGQKLKD